MDAPEQGPLDGALKRGFNSGELVPTGEVVVAAG
jgi:hypothetical protein